MADIDLTGRRVLAIVTNYGVEQDELLVPVRHLRAAGAEVDVAAPSLAMIRTLEGDRDPGVEADPTLTLAEADPETYDLLLVPGGTLNADSLRLNDTAIGIVRAFTAARGPVAAICHGAWAVVEAGVAGGKTMTSYPSLRTDIRNAGGQWIDESVVTDDSEGYLLITSRTPQDLPDFLREVDTALAMAPV
ncbi:type 1 glutamine amidotransferase [Streptomyces sp. AJS327]|uniref:type 1 glutamine amidotransferase domain-containing protein n=1 Tax=Streptomyces sp. AJS327 TaxID=2545265 RepID=UPI0015DE4BDB|nr:type 1 glutamine amidotransferase domain-containing protein [Streptomyces sp. AJS327]MBA0052956.1 type 1 glutamine amidotransferase [Streptomyces sp. AJS327]